MDVWTAVIVVVLVVPLYATSAWQLMAWRQMAKQQRDVETMVRGGVVGAVAATGAWWLGSALIGGDRSRPKEPLGIEGIPERPLKPRPPSAPSTRRPCGYARRARGSAGASDGPPCPPPAHGEGLGGLVEKMRELQEAGAMQFRELQRARERFAGAAAGR